LAEARYVFTQPADQMLAAYQTAAVERGWTLGHGDPPSTDDGWTSPGDLCATREVDGHRQELSIIFSHTGPPPEDFFFVTLNADDSLPRMSC
jgi:hypothetical protein